MILADLGADVVKVESPHVGDYLRVIPPGRGGLSGRYLALNRGKRSLVLDLKADAGAEALRRMVRHADILVESFRPGVMDRLGLGYAELAALRPELVMCSISGYGQTGPYAQRAGHDLNYVGMAGVLALGGSPGGAPALPGVQIADLAGGALWGATGILAALVQRQQTGRGAHLDISMTEGALALLAAELGALDCGGSAARGREALNGGMACYQVYRTSDGRYLSVGSLEPKFWLAFNQAIGRSGSVSELAGGAEQQARTKAEVAALIAGRSLAEWTERLTAFDCCCEPVLEVDELAGHPLHRARDVFFHIDGGALGSIQQIRTPLGTPRNPRPAPRHGEHSAEILGDYGFADHEVAQLVSGGEPHE